MNVLRFNIYDYQIEIKSSAFPLKNLKTNIDFSFFSVAQISACNLQIFIAELRLVQPQGIKLGTTAMCEVRQTGLHSRQLIYRHAGRTLAVLFDSTSETVRKIEIQTLTPEVIDDIHYFALNSCAGEFLDTQGLMRVHALSFAGQTAVIVHGSPGAGKSTLAHGLLNETSCNVYSDEITIFDIYNNRLLPYPLRVALKESDPQQDTPAKFNVFFDRKSAFAIPQERVAVPMPPRTVFLLRIGHFPQSAAGLASRAMFWLDVVSGRGLIQMWEFLLRPGNLKTIAKILRNRLRLAKKLLRLKPEIVGGRLPLEENLKRMTSISSELS